MKNRTYVTLIIGFSVFLIVSGIGVPWSSRTEVEPIVIANNAENTPPTIQGIDTDATIYVPGEVVVIMCQGEDTESPEQDLTGTIWIRHVDSGEYPVTDTPMLWDDSLRHYYRWTIPDDAAIGLYDVTCTLTDPGGLSDTESEEDLFEVIPNRVPPTVIGVPGSQTASAGDTITYDFYVTNNDADNWRSSLFQVSYTIPEGWSASVKDDTIRINPGDTRRVEVRVTSAQTATPGSYSITVTAENIDVETPPYPTGSDTVIYYIAQQNPIASAGGPYTGTEGTSILFDGSGSVDPDGVIVSYTWMFGDGTTGTGMTPTHMYIQEGEYGITLTVTDETGLTDTAESTVTIIDAAPSAAFTANPLSGEAPLTVTFSDTSTSYDDIIAWQWDFGDGKRSAEPNPTYTYSLPGIYTVSLSVEESDGDTDEVQRVDYIRVTVGERGAPTVTLSPSQSIGYPGIDQRYVVTIKNNDAPGYTPTVFSITATAPPEWGTQLSTTSIRLAPGVIDTSITLTVQVPYTASPQNYSLTITVTNTVDQTYQSTTSATHQVLEGRQNPDVAVNPLQQQGVNGSSLTYTITIFNNDPPPFSTSTFRIDYQLPRDWTGAMNQSMIQLASKASAKIMFTITSSTGEQGDYTFTIIVTNIEDSTFSTRVTGIYTVVRLEDIDEISPTITVSIDPAQPSPQQATFTISASDDPSGSGIIILRLYVDNTLLTTWESGGTYTYVAGPFDAGSHSFYLEALDRAGNKGRSPLSGTQQFFLVPSIPWYLLLGALVLIGTLFFIIYYGMWR